MNFDLPKKIKPLVNNAHQVALSVFRPISRKYDRAEHEYPKELDMLASVLDGMNDGDPTSSAGASQTGKGRGKDTGTGVKNGANMTTCLGALELCYGDVGLLLSMPRQGLGNAAIAAVANDEQLERFKGKWAAMAITEPGAGSDSAAIRTTAKEDGDHYVLNGEKIYVTSGERADCVVVWASLDLALGRAAIKSFVVEWGTPGMELARLEKKLGIRASDTAAINFNDCRVPKENLLGNPEVDVAKGFAGVMETFDNTRPLVACFALGCAKAALDRTRELLAEHVKLDYEKPIGNVSAVEAELYTMEAEWEAAYLLTVKAAWMADNRIANSVEASISKAKAGRVGNYITLRCVELCGALGYTETELLEKWARDSKILDIFEGTQQIQLLIIARRLLGLSSRELK
ncbi:MAG: acyl-CoA dehydrogenase family protein [Alcanivorax sp.]|nr:acyl-CoA dehydrogenase family protein [Alcanivorax sp.]